MKLRTDLAFYTVNTTTEKKSDVYIPEHEEADHCKCNQQLRHQDQIHLHKMTIKYAEKCHCLNCSTLLCFVNIHTALISLATNP